MPHSRTLLFCLLTVMVGTVCAQQFQIPMEMLQQMMGGGGMEEEPQLQWPSSIKSEVAPEFEWLGNTQWKGKTSSFKLMSDGSVESDLRDCKKGTCLWTANNGQMMLLTPRSPKQPMRFYVIGSDAYSKGSANQKEAQSRLDRHDEDEMKKVVLESTTENKAGKKSKLVFDGVMGNENEASLIAKDLYAVLGVEETASQSAVKSSYRRLSIQHHPDKGGDQQLFNEIREAYEILSDVEKRKWYDLGGVLLVKNMETGLSEVQGQEAQAMANLDQQVPKNHPLRAQYEAQVRSQIPSMEQAKAQLARKMTQEDADIPVPITLAETFTGVSGKTFDFPRLVICRGCRADPNSEACKECGKCPAERRQVAKRGALGFMTGVREVEVESKERCRTVPVSVPPFNVERGVADGALLRHVSHIGHQTPGRVPGSIVLRVSRQPDETYTAAGANLYTVLTISLAESVFGFSKTWKHLDGSTEVKAKHAGPVPAGHVIKVSRMGLWNPKARSSGDLFVRVAVDMPAAPAGDSVTLARPTPDEAAKVQLAAEHKVDTRDNGDVWRHWVEAEEADRRKKKKKSKKARADDDEDD